MSGSLDYSWASASASASMMTAATAIGMASESSEFRNNSRRSSVLECRVCDNVFGLQGDKTPRLLFCGHSFCHPCLVRLVNPSTQSICCPLDRSETILGPNGVWDLKKNFALIELIERLNEKPDLFLLPPPAFLEKERELEVPCDENEDHIAVVYCTTCGTHLCENCSEITHSTRTLGKHRRIPLSEKPKEKPKCPYHSSHVMEFTCLEPECAAIGSSSLMCYICKDYGRHKGHKHNLLELEAEKVRNNFNGVLQRLKRFMEDITQSSRLLEAAENRILAPRMAETGEQGLISEPGTAETAKHRVRQYFQWLRDQLTMQEVAANTVVDTYIRERLCSIRQQEEEMAALLNQVAAVCVHCDRVVKQDDARLLTAAPEINKMLETVLNQEKQFVQVDADSSIPITFTKDNRVHIGPKIEMRVVTLGLDGAGKTSILFKLKQDEFIQTIPTIGFNVETLEYKNIKFTIWDVGGQPKLRPLWRHYYLNTQAVIFVIDSNDRERMNEAKNELVKLMSEKDLKDACLLIFVNKQDSPDCVSIEEITESFSLYKLLVGRSWHIQACDARTGQGLTDGLDWLSRQLVASGVNDLEQ